MILEVRRNRKTQKLFIVIQDENAHKARLVSPDGKVIILPVEFFEEAFYEESETLLQEQNITRDQLDAYGSAVHVPQQTLAGVDDRLLLQFRQLNGSEKNEFVRDLMKEATKTTKPRRHNGFFHQSSSPEKRRGR